MKRTMLLIALLSSALLGQHNRLANGIYAVVNTNATGKNLVTRPYDGKNVVLDTASFAPFIIEGNPKVTPGPRASSLTVQLAPEPARRLEGLTRSNINQSIAIVVGDKILSIPTVRTAITDGKARITPCQEASCETLLRELAR